LKLHMLAQRKSNIPFPTKMFPTSDTSTSQASNALSVALTIDPLAFPKNRTDTQPPPATAFREASCCDDAAGTDARALFATIRQPLMVTLNTSKVAIAPPHVEHGCVKMFGQPIKPPNAELLKKELFWTMRNVSLSEPATDTAPPLAALQLVKLHCDTVKLLLVADMAPPLELKFWQF
jgi:hypothetical protein